MPQEETAAAGDRYLLITRDFDAPRALVFEAWTEPRHLVRWWGPNGFTTPECNIDARPGGAYRFRMHSPDGRDFWWYGVCREILPQERIVWSCILDGENGTRISSETLLTVTFAEYQGKTRLTLRQSVFDSAVNCDSHRDGWTKGLGRLAEHLAAIQ